MALIPKARIQDLLKAQCRVFQQSYNPTCTRTGAKVLRAPLRGPKLASYYPPRLVTIRTLRKTFPDLDFLDEKEAERADRLVMLKAKGKSAPKKKRTAEESKKATGARKKPLAPPKP